jgi:hypothetical protein
MKLRAGNHIVTDAGLSVARKPPQILFFQNSNKKSLFPCSGSYKSSVINDVDAPGIVVNQRLTRPDAKKI